MKVIVFQYPFMLCYNKKGGITMNEKQKKFCDEYLTDFNTSAAAVRAGYSKTSAWKTGARILKTPQAKEYLNSKLNKISSRKTAEAEEVLEYLTAVMRGEKWGKAHIPKGENLPAEKDGAITVRDRMKAAELLGKLYGIFSDKGGGAEIVPVIISGEEDLSD